MEKREDWPAEIIEQQKWENSALKTVLFLSLIVNVILVAVAVSK